MSPLPSSKYSSSIRMIQNHILLISCTLLTILSITFFTFIKATPITIDDTSAIIQYLTDIGGGGACDGLPALNTSIFSPGAAQFNSKGELIFLDGNYRIRKVDVNGISSTIAGNGFAGYNGDGIDAVKALVNAPFQLLINERDEIIFSDSNNNRVRKILTNGTIITIAGNGKTNPMTETLNKPKGLALNSQGELIIADSGHTAVRKLLTNGTLVTVATDPNYQPLYVAHYSSSNDIYVEKCPDTCVIDKISTSGNVTTLAGQGKQLGDCLKSSDCALPSYGGMSFSNNGSGDLYFSDFQRIRRLYRNGTISTICGIRLETAFNGDNIDASLAKVNPGGIFLTPENEVLFTDVSNNRIRMITKYGKVKTIAGNGEGNGVYSFCGDGSEQAINVPLYGPGSIAINSKDEIIFSDRLQTVGHVIRKISKNGIISTIAGTGSPGFNGDGIATLSKLSVPKGMFITENDEIIFADSNNHRVRKILTNGAIITIAGTINSKIIPEPILAINATLNTPSDIAINSKGEILIADSGNHRILKILTNGLPEVHLVTMEQEVMDFLQ